MFNRRNEFNGKTPQNSNYIFASGVCMWVCVGGHPRVVV